jgi:hypothetical protein
VDRPGENRASCRARSPKFGEHHYYEVGWIRQRRRAKGF